NLDKVIVKGNPIKRTVSFIVEDSKITDYFDKERIPYAVIANVNSDFSKEREYILGEERHEEISDLNSLLNKNKINSKICVINYSNLDYCLEKKYFIIAPTIQTESNIITLLSNINSGSIILIKKGANIDNIKLIKQEIKKQDLKIEYLSEHITENS
ncbi:MAG: hypothetical protein PHF21_04375, partial [Bacilli bacterium]|nr:hypothetical protein [Bacilli bacterium]